MSQAGSPRSRTGFDPKQVHVGFVVNKVSMGLFLQHVLQFFPVSIIPAMHRTHSFVTDEI
jgi:hypothetical protein